MKPDGLLDADVICCKGADCLGTLIEWGEDIDGKGDDSLSHIEAYFGLMTADILDAALGDMLAGDLNPGDPVNCRMNPPCSQLYALSALPADRVKVARLDMLTGFGPDLPVPRFPGEDSAFVEIFHTEVLCHLGEPYAYEQIGADLVERLVDFVDPAAVEEYQHQPSLVAKIDAALGRHAAVCCEWLRQRINNAMRKCYQLPDFELLPGVGTGASRPCDYALSPYLNFDVVTAVE